MQKLKWGGPAGWVLISLSIQTLTLWTLQITATQKRDCRSDRHPWSSLFRGACVSVYLYAWWMVNSPKALPFLENTSLNLNSPVTTPKQFEVRAGMPMPANLLTECRLYQVPLLWHKQNFNVCEIWTRLNSLLNVFEKSENSNSWGRRKFLVSEIFQIYKKSLLCSEVKINPI